MKNKRTTNEGLSDMWNSLKRGVSNARTDFTGTTQELGDKNSRVELIKNLVAAVDQNIRAGQIDTNSPLPDAQAATPSPSAPATDTQQAAAPTTAAPKPSIAPTTPASSGPKIGNTPIHPMQIRSMQNNVARDKRVANMPPPSKKTFAPDRRTPAEIAKMRRAGFRENAAYDKLNALFESILENTSTSKMSIYDFLKQYSINQLPSTTPQELQALDPVLRDLHTNWKNKSQRTELLNKYADLIQVLNKRRYDNRSQQDTQQATQSGQQARQSGQTSQNPQQQYTSSLTNQIERMTTDYRDDIPVIVTTLLDKLKQMDPNGFKTLVDTIKTPPSQPSTTTESKRPKKRV